MKELLKYLGMFGLYLLTSAGLAFMFWRLGIFVKLAVDMILASDG